MIMVATSRRRIRKSENGKKFRTTQNALSEVYGLIGEVGSEACVI